MYTLASGRQKTISERVSSFWIHLTFSIENSNAAVRLSGAHVAVYLTYNFSSEEVETKHKYIPFPGDVVSTDTLEITGTQPTASLSIKRASLQRKIAIRRSNEVGEMLFFKITGPGAAGEKAWLDADGWNPEIGDPKSNDDGASQFLPLRLDLGDAKGRFVHELAMDTDNAGLKRLAVVVDMLGKPLLAQITTAAVAGKTFPSFSLIPVNANATDVAGAQIPTSTGFIMAAVGAFAQIDADILLRDWNTSNTGSLVDQVSRLIFAPRNVASGEGRLVRKLHNVSATSLSDSQYLRHIGNVREVLYIEAGDNGPVGREVMFDQAEQNVDGAADA
jgi:hypothetical protein